MFPVIVAALVAPTAEPSVRVETLTGGYRVTLTRPAAERLQAALAAAGDEQKLADTVREVGKHAGEKLDADAAVLLDLIAASVATQLPGFKKSLAENLGPYGVTVRVYGVPRDRVLKRDRPVLRALVGAAREAMPADARGTLDGVLTAAKTTPLTWKVEPRK